MPLLIPPMLVHPPRPLRLALLALLAGLGPASAEYRLAPGDVIEITVADFGELNQRVPVQSDGTVAVARVGVVSVGGLSGQAMQERLQAAMAAKVIRRPAADGRDLALTIEADQVVARVVEYRPVFVTGDVAKPGEQAFRIGMTVRQATALAGGLGVAGAPDPTRGLDLGTDELTLWHDYAAGLARLWRLRAELGSDAPLDRATLDKAPLPGDTVDRIVAAEERSLQASRDDRQREGAASDHAVARIDASIAVVTKQKADEETGTTADAADLRTVLDLMARGNVTSSRVNEARRAVLLASTRNLQTQAELLRLQRQRDEVTDQLARRDDERRRLLLQQEADTAAGIDTIGLKLAAVQQKLRLLGVAGAESERRPALTIFRADPQGESRLSAEERTTLEPGDVLEVRLSRPGGVTLSAR